MTTQQIKLNAFGNIYSIVTMNSDSDVVEIQKFVGPRLTSTFTAPKDHILQLMEYIDNRKPDIDAAGCNTYEYL